jgi:hypothetical protein
VEGAIVSSRKSKAGQPLTSEELAQWTPEDGGGEESMTCQPLMPHEYHTYAPDGGGKVTPAPAPGKPVQRFKPFPVNALPATVSCYITALARAIGCDLAFVALPLLAALASAIGNTRRTFLKHTWREPCILWTAILGDSGTHKTPALSAAMSILERKQVEALAAYESKMTDYEQKMLVYEAELAAWKRASAKTRGEPPEKPEEPIAQRYIVSDTTIEALADRLQYAPRGLLQVRDELAGWFHSFDQYKGGKGGDTAHWLSLYNAKPLTIDRKTTAKKLIHVPIASVSIAGGIQPETLARALGREHFENGLAARLLVAMPPKSRRRWTDATVSEQVERDLERVFDRLLALDFGIGDGGRPQPIDLPLTPEARTAWIEFYNRHGGEQMECTGNDAALMSKIEGTAPRLALIVQLATDAQSMAVDEMSMKASITLAEWFGREGRRVYGVLGESDEQREHRRLVELIEQKGGRITVRELSRTSRRYAAAEMAEAALEGLASAGIGFWEHLPVSATGGRPSREFVLYPAADADKTCANAADIRVVSTSTDHEDMNRLLDEAAAVDADEI